MNDQHAHAGYVGHDSYPTGSFGTDPLFGALPGDQGGYETGHSGQYDSTQWDTGTHGTTGYDMYGAPEPAHQPHEVHEAHGTLRTEQAQGFAPYDATGQWDASAWNQSTETGRFETAAATFSYDATGQWAAPAFETGTYDATAWNADGADPLPLVPQQYTPEQELGGYGGVAEADDFPAEFASGTHSGTQEFGPELMRELDQQLGADTPEYTDAHEYAETPEFAGASEYQVPDFGTSGYGTEEPHHQAYGTEPADTGTTAEGVAEAAAAPALGSPGEHDGSGDPDSLGDLDNLTGADGLGPGREHGLLTGAAPVAPRPVRRAGSGGGRGRRRTPAKRSALLTVAVPSACVMGVAGIAAASVGGLGGETKQETTKLAAADAPSVKAASANSKLDTQLAALSAEARDFGDRASRTQERIDLKARQKAERQKREEEAKRRELLRPKFALPVKQKGLSTYYGQSGVNWMALHTGIDFPVSYGSEVMAATDGTVRTQFNSAYGNMVIVTAPDGTETWYCHLASAKVRSGKVKAGDVIAYSGNSGNSTGPHLHFEVRPGGGSTINPLTWLQSHGLSPV
ncbi:M23 family metallopeptidase [Streptomyces sp. NPDC004838]